MKSTSNHGLKKPEPLIDNVNIDVINLNMDIVDKGLAIYLGSTSGSANAYTIASDDIKALSEGLAVCIKIHTASTAASTLNVNGWGAKAIKKAGGADATNLKAGIYTLRYDGANFILQGEGASGDAAASDLLLGKKATTDAGEITGTMPAIGPVEAETVNLTTQNQEYVIAYGRHSGLRKIKAVISGLIAGVIKAGTTVGGILGTYTSDATATDSDVLNGKYYYRNGVKGTGNIPVKEGDNAASAVVVNASGSIFLTPPAGYYDGNDRVYSTDADFIASNIVSGKNIFGLVGTAVSGIPGISGITQSIASTQYCLQVNGETIKFDHHIEVTGLPFKPSIIIAYYEAFNTPIGRRAMIYSKNATNPGFATILLTNDGYYFGVHDKEYSAASAYMAYVNNTGFKLPVLIGTPGSNFKWIALQ